MRIKHTPSQIEKAEELIQVMSIWGISRLDAVAIANRIQSEVIDMSDKKYAALAGGASIKPAPTDAEIAALVKH